MAASLFVLGVGLTFGASQAFAQAPNAHLYSLGAPYGQNLSFNGETITLTTQIGYGTFAGFGNAYVYSYTVTNTGNKAIAGFNVYGGGRQGLTNALTLGTDMVVSDAGDDRGDADMNLQLAPGLVVGTTQRIPDTPGATVVGNNVNLPTRPNYIEIASSDDPVAVPPGGWYESSFPGLGLYNANPNATTFTVDMNDPGSNLNSPGNNQMAEGTGTNPGWGFTDWSYRGTNVGADKTGNLIRWYSTVGTSDLLHNQTMTFDLLSLYGPVPAGAFPDPDFDEVSVGIDDDSSADEADTFDDDDTDIPEPFSAALLLPVAGIALLRRTPRAI
jgi:hypothetical protein